MEKKLEKILKFNLKKLLKIVFQPIYSLDGQIVTYEVLSRFYDEEVGEIETLEAIKTLENLGLIHNLDFLVLKKIKKYLKTEKSIAINISSTTILKDEFLEKVLALGSKIKKLEIELVERGEIDYDELFVRVSELKTLGIKIVMDDFPIENSSLETLLRIKIDKVKVDRSLLKNIDSTLGREVYKGIINLLKAMKKEITIEGIETAEELEFIKEIGVDFIQGYYMSRPILENELKI